MLVKYTVEIAGVVLKKEQCRAMEARYGDLQQQSDRGENLTEPAQTTGSRGRRAAISPLVAHNLIRSA
jgi:hypothetical protein